MTLYTRARPVRAFGVADRRIMTGSTRSSEGLNARQRRLLFRSWHRGIREADLLLGRFADAHIADLSESELDAYERLLDVPDHDLYAWVTGERDIPESERSDLLDRIIRFQNGGGL
jgi:antitoxin CptB